MEVILGYILIGIAVIVIIWLLFKPRNENFDLVKMSTIKTPQGDNKPPTLAPLNVDCKNQAINKFHLARDITSESEKILYDYNCTKDVNFGKPTSALSVAGPSKDFMDLTKQYIDCQGKPVIDFQLQNVDSENMQYAYKCGTVPLTEIKDSTTPWDEPGWVINLDRHTVDCQEGKVLSSVKLTEDAPNKKIRYEYKCGVPGTVPEPSPAWYETTPFKIIVGILICLCLSSSIGSAYSASKGEKGTSFSAEAGEGLTLEGESLE
ncbi:MAG: hypothetical protein Edafosvirus35_4 [Edafosvirus sp.]|uniref:Uncharacterized protein n=1 Tax=Edafosvirus sp. TaxID=2487765 RepID=A0A3G4ZV77_9VIRU|nr:MAG: hypothetical protein Edafosvirus35_4 [Edafosvirus sp.]